MTEDQLQSKCFQWTWNTHPETRYCLWAVPNGGDRRPYEAARLKATGVVSGVHDLHFLWKGKFYTFELKVGSNKLSPHQITFGCQVLLHGGEWYEIRDFETFQKTFLGIIGKTI